MKFSLVCPHCRHQNVVGPQDCGKARQCPQCSKVFYCAALPSTPVPPQPAPKPEMSATNAWVSDLTGTVLAPAPSSAPSAAIESAPTARPVAASAPQVVVQAELVDDVPMAKVVRETEKAAASQSVAKPVALASRKALYVSLSVGGVVLLLLIVQIIVLAVGVKTSDVVQLDANGAFRHDGMLMTRGPNGVEARFKAQFEAGHRYVVQHKSGDYDAFLTIQDEAGRMLAQNDDFQGLDSRIDFIAPVTGHYVIVARPLDSQSVGRFSVTVDEDRIVAQNLKKIEEKKLAPPPAPRPIELNGHGMFRIDSDLTGDDPLQNAEGRRFRAYMIRLKASNPYRFELRSRRFNPLIEVFDSDRRLVASEDDHGGAKTSARKDFVPERTGDYKIVVGPRAGILVGDFALEVSDLQANPWMVAVAPGKVEAKGFEAKKIEEKKVEETKFEPKKTLIDDVEPKEPQTFQLTWEGFEPFDFKSKLTRDDGRQQLRGRRCRIYLVNVDKGFAYQFQLSSDAFRPLLEITDYAGNRIPSQKIDAKIAGRVEFECTKTDLYKFFVGPVEGVDTGEFALVGTKEKNNNFVEPPVPIRKIGEAKYERLEWEGKERAVLTSRLNEEDGRYKGIGRRCRIVEVSLEKDVQYFVGLHSMAFAPFVKVLDDEGEFIDSNDGSKYDVMHVVPKRTAVYRFFVGPQGAGLDTGPFEFSITRLRIGSGKSVAPKQPAVTKVKLPPMPQSSPTATKSLRFDGQGKAAGSGSFELDGKGKIKGLATIRHSIRFEKDRWYEVSLSMESGSGFLLIDGIHQQLAPRITAGLSGKTATRRFRAEESSEATVSVAPHIGDEAVRYSFTIRDLGTDPPPE